MKRLVLALLSLACFSLPAMAGGLHPACNISMPCQVLADHFGEVTKKIGKADARRATRGARLERQMPFGRAIVRPSEEPSLLSSPLVERARAYLGQTASQIGVRRSLWCSAFLRRITGARGVDDRAISWLAKPRVGPVVGSIAVMRHHVGIVAGFNGRGDPIIVSGNHGRRVGEGVYSRRLVLAYVGV